MRKRSSRLRPPALGAAVLLALLLHSAPEYARAGGFACADLDTVLAAHVHGEVVDYGALRADPGPLRRFLARTRDAEPDGWPPEAQIAFWVNVYNARVLDGVIRRPGLGSVLDPGKVLGVPTLAFFREKRVTAGEERSLDDIEHGILRGRFSEPRIHFVLNCASRSCPPLPPRALRGDSLEAALRAATAGFLTDTARNRVPPSGPLELSHVFKWFRGDFEKSAGSVQGFLVRHWPGEPPPDLATRRIRWLDYDWSLNGHW